MKYLLLLSALLLTACVTPSISTAKVASITALPWQPGDLGFYYDDSDKAAFIYAGADPKLFIQTARGWYLSEAAWNQATDQVKAKGNTGVWNPATNGAAKPQLESASP
jgi:hypothetical protein